MTNLLCVSYVVYLTLLSYLMLVIPGSQLGPDIPPHLGFCQYFFGSLIMSTKSIKEPLPRHFTPINVILICSFRAHISVSLVPLPARHDQHALIASARFLRLYPRPLASLGFFCSYTVFPIP